VIQSAPAPFPKHLEISRFEELPEYDDNPSAPGPASIDPPDLEFDRLLAWFVQNRKEIAAHYGVKKVVLRVADGFELRGLSRQLKKQRKAPRR